MVVVRPIGESLVCCEADVEKMAKRRDSMSGGDPSRHRAVVIELVKRDELC
jgi:hypothetical protein